MKVIRSNTERSSFGGALAVLKQLRDLRVPEFIQECLGQRRKQAKYSYADIFIGWMLTNFCGGYRLDHITKYKEHLAILPDLKLCSHDTLGRVLKQLATETEISFNQGHTTDKKKNSKKPKFKRDDKASYTYTAERQINENIPMNKLLVHVTKGIGLLNENESYILDVDATTIPTECYDAAFSYKQMHAYSPMISSIGQLPVYIETRNGNVAPTTRIQENIQRSRELLSEYNITIGKVRMDSAGYVRETMEYLEDEGIKFYIAGKKKASAMNAIQAHDEWRPFQLETVQSFWDCECADVEYRMTHGKHIYRLVVLRTPIERKTPTKWITGEKYHYKIVATNDFESSAEEVVRLLNARGASERLIDTLKNYHGFRLPPFSFMNQNAVFLIVAALSNNVYRAIVQTVSEDVKELRPESRLKEFIFVFMTISLEFIDDAAVFGKNNIPYEKFC